MEKAVGKNFMFFFRSFSICLFSTEKKATTNRLNSLLTQNMSAYFGLLRTAATFVDNSGHDVININIITIERVQLNVCFYLANHTHTLFTPQVLRFSVFFSCRNLLFLNFSYFDIFRRNFLFMVTEIISLYKSSSLVGMPSEQLKDEQHHQHSHNRQQQENLDS